MISRIDRHLDQDSNSNAIFLGAALAMALVLRALPIWTIGFFQDDALYSAMRFDAVLTGRSIYEYCYGFAKAVFLFQGRFAPGGPLLIMPLQLAVEDNLLLYRTIQSAVQLLALGVFTLFVRALSKSTLYALLCALVFASIFEIRNYHDSAFGYFIIVPFVIALGAAACYFAVKCGDEDGAPLNGKFWAIPALNLVGLLTYELVIPFCLASCLILLSHGKGSRRTRVLRFVIAGLPILLVIGVGIVTKSTMSSYEGTMVGTLSASAIGGTYVKQIVASFPLSYWMLDPHSLFKDLLHDQKLYPQTFVAAIALFISTASAMFVGTWRAQARNSTLLLIVGLILFWLFRKSSG